MTKHVDLNADMGESFGRWTMGNDAALLDIVTSANIACGFHAGDPDIMAHTMRMATAKGVGIGAHPGFSDLQGFGRQRMDLPAETLQNSIRYQLGASQAIAQANGTSVRHFKLHGALANMAAEDVEIARLCYTAALELAPKMVIVVMASTAMEQAVQELKCAWAGEIFADRAYNDDATLVDRRLPGAVIHDPAQAATQITNMVKAGAVITTSGKHIPTRIDTICVHGDTAQACQIALAVKNSLHSEGVIVRKF